VRSAGGVIGIDWQAAWDLRVGIAAGGSESSFSVADLQTSGRITGGHIGAYAKKTWDAWYAAASVSYARFSNSTTRMITGVGDTEAASGRFDSDQFGARFEIGRKHAYAGINVTPFVAVEPAVLWQHGFTETGPGLSDGARIRPGEQRRSSHRSSSAPPATMPTSRWPATRSSRKRWTARAPRCCA